MAWVTMAQAARSAAAREPRDHEWCKQHAENTNLYHTVPIALAAHLAYVKHENAYRIPLSISAMLIKAAPSIIPYGLVRWEA